MRSSTGVALLMILASCGEPPETRSNVSAAAMNATVAIDAENLTPDEIRVWPTVTAADLSAAYQKNEAAAQLFYSGRPLKVTGVIKNVDMTFGDPIVVLRGVDAYGPGIGKNGKFSDVRLSGLTTEQAAAFEIGRNFAFMCHDISVTLGSPHLTRCAPVEGTIGH